MWYFIGSKFWYFKLIAQKFVKNLEILHSTDFKSSTSNFFTQPISTKWNLNKFNLLSGRFFDKKVIMSLSWVVNCTISMKLYKTFYSFLLYYLSLCGNRSDNRLSKTLWYWDWKWFKYYGISWLLCKDWVYRLTETMWNSIDLKGFLGDLKVVLCNLKLVFFVVLNTILIPYARFPQITNQKSIQFTSIPTKIWYLIQFRSEKCNFRMRECVKIGEWLWFTILFPELQTLIQYR